MKGDEIYLAAAFGVELSIDVKCRATKRHLGEPRFTYLYENVCIFRSSICLSVNNDRLRVMDLVSADLVRELLGVGG